jgi:hypothetical protein
MSLIRLSVKSEVVTRTEHERHRKAKRDAIDLPLFQLTEERAHLGPRRLRSVGYSGHHVEPGNGYAKFHSRSHNAVIRVCDEAAKVIAAGSVAKVITLCDFP